MFFDLFNIVRVHFFVEIMLDFKRSKERIDSIMACTFYLFEHFFARNLATIIKYKRSRKFCFVDAPKMSRFDFPSNFQNNVEKPERNTEKRDYLCNNQFCS